MVDSVFMDQSVMEARIAKPGSSQIRTTRVARPNDRYDRDKLLNVHAE